MPGISLPPGFTFRVEDLIEAEGGREAAYRQLARSGMLSSVEFIDALHDDLDDAIEQLQNAAPSFIHAAEDSMSRSIVGFLVGRDYDAWSEVFLRGHVDIFVSNRRLKAKWNAEAKIHRTYDYGIEGMRQLLTRYASGAHRHGGFLLYVFQRKALNIQKKWRKKIEGDTASDSCATLRAEDEKDWRFRTIHEHASGAEYTVRHHVVLMHFAPKDASGRANATDYSDDEEIDEES